MSCLVHEKTSDEYERRGWMIENVLTTSLNEYIIFNELCPLSILIVSDVAIVEFLTSFHSSAGIELMLISLMILSTRQHFLFNDGLIVLCNKSRVFMAKDVFRF
jgi:hypothetical protein